VGWIGTLSRPYVGHCGLNQQAEGLWPYVGHCGLNQQAEGLWAAEQLSEGHMLDTVV